MLKLRDASLCETVKNAVCSIDEQNRLFVLSYKDTKYLEKFNSDSNLIITLQELLYEYLGFLYKIEVRNTETIKRANIDERKADLKNRRIVKEFVDKLNASIESIDVY